MSKQLVSTGPGTKPGLHAQAVRFGNLLYISGQVALENGKVVGGADCELQAQQVFKNMESILKAAGGTFSDVLKVTCFLVNPDDLPAYNSVRSKIFAVEPPASTTVIVKRLGWPEFLIEIEAVAGLSA